MKSIIGWTFANNLSSSLYYDPIPLGVIQKNRSSSIDGVSACPAVKVFENRIFVVRSPYTFRFRAQRNNSVFEFCPVFPDTEVQEDILRSLIEFQPKSNWRSKNTPILQLSLPYVFFSDVNAYVNQIEAPFDCGLKNWSLIQGRFNIYDWQRPINWSIEWIDTSQDLIIKRGQPLFSLLIETENPDGTLELKYVERNDEIERVLQASNSVSKLTHGTFGLLKEAGKKRPKKLIKSAPK